MQTTLHHLADQLRTAAADGQVLSIQGGGSKAFYGNLSHHHQILNTRQLTGIISHEPSELCLTAWAGTPLTEVNDALAGAGQCLAFEPPTFGGAATVGGMVAAGLSGPTRAVVGGVRDFVLGLHLMNAQGELLQFGGQVMKNVAGYDVSRSLSGSMGQLGLITQVSLKVLPQPAQQTTLQCAGLTQASALQLLNQWRSQPLPILASAWLNDTTLQPAQGVLFVRLGGAKAAIASAAPQITQAAQALGAQVTTLSPDAAARDWQAHTNLQIPIFSPAPAPTACLWRVSVAPSAPVLPDFETACTDWLGGVRWLWAPAHAANTLRDWAQQHGGHATLFYSSTQHGDSDKRTAGGAFTPLPSLHANLHQRLRASFDPSGLFNTGRLMPVATGG